MKEPSASQNGEDTGDQQDTQWSDLGRFPHRASPEASDTQSNISQESLTLKLEPYTYSHTPSMYVLEYFRLSASVGGVKEGEVGR